MDHPTDPQPGDGPRRLRRVTLAQTKVARRQLGLSRILALAILPLFLIALAIAVYAPRHAGQGQRTVVVTSDGMVICTIGIGQGDNRLIVVSPRKLAVSLSQVVGIDLETW